MALDPPANGERGEEEEEAEGAVDGDDGDDGGEIEEDQVEEDDPLVCVICLGSETEEDDVMLLCCDVKCGRAAHRSCASALRGAA